MRGSKRRNTGGGQVRLLALLDFGEEEAEEEEKEKKKVPGVVV